MWNYFSFSTFRRWRIRKMKNYFDEEYAKSSSKLTYCNVFNTFQYPNITYRAYIMSFFPSFHNVIILLTLSSTFPHYAHYDTENQAYNRSKGGIIEPLEHHSHIVTSSSLGAVNQDPIMPRGVNSSGSQWKKFQSGTAPSYAILLSAVTL